MFSFPKRNFLRFKTTQLFQSLQENSQRNLMVLTEISIL